MQTTYSIAEARNKFTTLIRDVENNAEPVSVTRHGREVVVILSSDEYERLTKKSDPLAVYDAWRAKMDASGWWDDDDGYADWADVRDKTPLPENNPWL